MSFLVSVCRRAVRTAVLIAGIVLILSSTAARAATITVGGGCTLTDAIVAANTNAVSGACTAGSGTDTIVLQASTSYPIISVDNTDGQGPTGLPVITSDILLQGNNASIEHLSGPSLRLLRVGAGGTLTLDHVNLRYGDLGSPTIFDGGGVLVESGAILTVTDSLIGSNGGRNGGALFVAAGGSATVTGTIFSGNYARESGGAIGNDGTLSLTDSVIANGSLSLANGQGGGIGSTGSLIVRRTTVHNNYASRGGGLFVAGTTELTNSTVGNNSAEATGGGLEVAGGAVTVRNSTIVQNVASAAGGGGILTSGGTVTLANSIVAANATGAPGSNWDSSYLLAANADCGGGGVTSSGHNLVGGGAGCPSGGSGDKTEPPATVLTRVLGPRANNGGPATSSPILTHHPRPASPVLDAGDNAICGAAPVGAVDQRGRPRGGACDIGAVEATFGQITVTGGCTLADAITAANTDAIAGGCSAGSGADTIILQAAGPFTLTTVNNTGDQGPNGLPAVISMVKIVGNGKIVERGGGAPSFRIFAVRDGGDLTLDEVLVRNGQLDNGRGAGIGVFGGYLTLTDAEVSGGTSASGTSNSFGGGIAVEVNGNFSDALLTLTNTVVKNNHADVGGGISHLRPVTITNSVIENNTARYQGGGVAASAPLKVTNSTIRGNQATELGNAVTRSSTGGGVMASGVGVLTVTGSTISGNSAVSGGGIYLVVGTSLSTVANSTISGNTSIGPAEDEPNGNNGGFAGAGIEVMRSPGGLALINSTVTDNRAQSTTGTGGILIGHFGGLNSTVTLSNTIVLGNQVASSLIVPRVDCGIGPTAGPGVTSNGNNLVGQGTGCPSGGAGDLTAQPADAFTLVLGALAANGGPTLTHALQDGSPAIDAGAVGVCAAAPVSAVDQRGTARARCDSGAYEGGTPLAPPGSPIVVGGQCTLIEAIEAANRDLPFGGCSAGQGADTIVLATNSTHTLSAAYETAADPGANGLPSITTDITIEGNGATIQRVSGGVQFRIFFVPNSGALTLRNVTVSSGRAADAYSYGSGIFVRGSGARLTLVGTTVRGNFAVLEGAGIANGETSVVGARSGGVVSLTNSTVTANSAASNSSAAYGGGIASRGGTLTLTNSLVSDNTATLYGGGVHIQGTTVSMTGGAISGNTAVVGGGLYNNGSQVTLTGVTVSANHADTSFGGGIYNTGRLTLSSSIVTGNTAQFGGGIVNLYHNFLGAGAGMTLESTTVSSNTSATGGAGIITYGPATLTNSTVENNTAATAGGGILVSSFKQPGPNTDRETILTVTGGFIRNNRSNGGQLAYGGGGGIANGADLDNPPGTVTLNATTISGNKSAGGDGGGVFNRGVMTVTGAIFTGNSSFAAGGGIASRKTIAADTGAVTLTNTTVNVNVAGTMGGGVFVANGGSLVATDATFSGNSSSTGGGGIQLTGATSTATLDRTTVATNKVTLGSGGGLANGLNFNSVIAGGALTLRASVVSGNQAMNADGGGIYNDASLRVTDSTVSGNTAATTGGGVVHKGDRLTIIAGSTVADNRSGAAGGGLVSIAGGVSFRNSIVAGNQHAGSLIASDADCAGPVISGDYNLVGAGAGCPTNGTGDLAVAPATVFSAVLGPLAENGGPTKTHALVSGSPAIDGGNPGPTGAGNPTGCSDTDQRGTARPVDGNRDAVSRCDIGAFEAAAGTTPARCSPRPNVHLAVGPAGSGRLQVTVSAGTSVATSTNSVQQLRIAAPASVVIDIVGGPSGATGVIDYTPPAGTSQVTFFVRRVVAGPVHVPLTVLDECGEWQTFVGGGPAAF